MIQILWKQYLPLQLMPLQDDFGLRLGRLRQGGEMLGHIYLGLNLVLEKNLVGILNN